MLMVTQNYIQYYMNQIAFICNWFLSWLGKIHELVQLYNIQYIHPFTIINFFSNIRDIHVLELSIQASNQRYRIIKWSKILKTWILANLDILENNQKQPRRTKIGCRSADSGHCGLVSARIEISIGNSHNLFGKAHLGGNRAVPIHKYAFWDEIEWFWVCRRVTNCQ